MAAKNTDSKRIFDRYINRYLTEVARSQESEEPEQQTSTASQDTGTLQTAGTVTNAPAQTSFSIPAAQGNPTISSQPQSISVPPQPTPAPQQATPQPTTAPQPSTPQGAPTDEEQSLLKKLHASDYNPKSSADQKRLEELRTAQTKFKEKFGREPSLQELATVSYAQQYGEKSPYYTQAQKMGINLGRPGDVVQPTAQSQGAIAQQQGGNATQQPVQGGAQGQGTVTQNQSQSFTPLQQDYFSQFVNNLSSKWPTLQPAQKEFLLKNFITPLSQLK